MNVVIFNTGWGNLGVVKYWLIKMGFEVTISSYLSQAHSGSVLVIPGMQNSVNLSRILHDEVNKLGVPMEEVYMKVIGICAGFHALCNSINEGNDYTSGLNIFNTSCVPIFNDGSHNTGWLNLEFNKSKFMHKVERSNSSFYFNHAYGVISKVSDCDEIIYGKEKIRVIVKKGIWWGVQFHPECSGTNGESLFKGIVKL